MLAVRPALAILQNRVNDPSVEDEEITPAFEFFKKILIPQFSASFSSQLPALVEFLFYLTNDTSPYVSREAASILIDTLVILGPHFPDVFHSFIVATVKEKALQHSTKVKYVSMMVKMTDEIIPFLRVMKVYELITCTSEYFCHAAITLKSSDIFDNVLTVVLKFDKVLRRLESSSDSRWAPRAEVVRLRRQLICSITKTIYDLKLLQQDLPFAEKAIHLAVIFTGGLSDLQIELLRKFSDQWRGLIVQFIPDFDLPFPLDRDRSFVQLRYYKHIKHLDKIARLFACQPEQRNYIDGNLSEFIANQVAYLDVGIELVKNNLVSYRGKHQEPEECSVMRLTLVQLHKELLSQNHAPEVREKFVQISGYLSLLVFWSYFCRHRTGDRYISGPVFRTLLEEKMKGTGERNAENEVRAFFIWQKLCWAHDIFVNFIVRPTRNSFSCKDIYFDDATIAVVIECLLTANYSMCSAKDDLELVIGLLSDLFKYDFEIDDELVSVFWKYGRYFNRGDTEGLFSSMYQTYEATENRAFLRIFAAIYDHCPKVAKLMVQFFKRFKKESQLCDLFLKDMPHLVLYIKAIKRIGKCSGPDQVVPEGMVRFVVLLLRLVIAILANDWSDTNQGAEYEEITHELNHSDILQRLDGHSFLEKLRKRELLDLRDLLSNCLFHLSYAKKHCSILSPNLLNDLASRTCFWPSKYNWRLISKESQIVYTALGIHSSNDSIALAAFWSQMKAFQASGKGAAEKKKKLAETVTELSRNSFKMLACAFAVSAKNEYCVSSPAFVKAFDTIWTHPDNTLPEGMDAFLRSSTGQPLVPFLKRNLNSKCVAVLLSTKVNELRFPSRAVWQRYGKFLYRVNRYVRMHKDITKVSLMVITANVIAKAASQEQLKVGFVLPSSNSANGNKSDRMSENTTNDENGNQSNSKERPLQTLGSRLSARLSAFLSGEAGGQDSPSHDDSISKVERVREITASTSCEISHLNESITTVINQINSLPVLAVPESFSGVETSAQACKQSRGNEDGVKRSRDRRGRASSGLERVLSLADLWDGGLSPVMDQPTEDVNSILQDSPSDDVEKGNSTKEVPTSKKAEAGGDNGRFGKVLTGGLRDIFHRTRLIVTDFGVSRHSEHSSNEEESRVSIKIIRCNNVTSGASDSELQVGVKSPPSEAEAVKGHSAKATAERNQGDSAKETGEGNQEGTSKRAGESTQEDGRKQVGEGSQGEITKDDGGTRNETPKEDSTKGEDGTSEASAVGDDSGVEWVVSGFRSFWDRARHAVSDFEFPKSSGHDEACESHQSDRSDVPTGSTQENATKETEESVQVSTTKEVGEGSQGEDDGDTRSETPKEDSTKGEDGTSEARAVGDDSGVEWVVSGLRSFWDRARHAVSDFEFPKSSGHDEGSHQNDRTEAPGGGTQEGTTEENEESTQEGTTEENEESTQEGTTEENEETTQEGTTEESGEGIWYDTTEETEESTQNDTTEETEESTQNDTTEETDADASDVQTGLQPPDDKNEKYPQQPTAESSGNTGDANGSTNQKVEGNTNDASNQSRHMDRSDGSDLPCRKDPVPMLRILDWIQYVSLRPEPDTDAD